MIISIIVYLFATLVAGESFTNTVNTIIPTACKDTCAPWVNLVGSCVEKSGNMTFNYDPSIGKVDFTGNKIGLYFCLCSNDACTTGGTCATCISTHYCLSPALNVETYNNVCSGNTDISILIHGTTAQC
jgi:hypothetical protein